MIACAGYHKEARVWHQIISNWQHPRKVAADDAEQINGYICYASTSKEVQEYEWFYIFILQSQTQRQNKVKQGVTPRTKSAKLIPLTKCNWMLP